MSLCRAGLGRRGESPGATASCGGSMSLAPPKIAGGYLFQGFSSFAFVSSTSAVLRVTRVRP